MRKPKKIIIGNWKMNPDTLEEAKKIWSAVKRSAKKVKNTNIIACPPFPYLNSLKSKEKNLFLGAQNVFFAKKGAFTGEVSAKMIRDSGASFVILGHSERRAMGETDEIISRKTETALAENLRPVVCVGEKERKESGEHFNFLGNQIKNSLAKISKTSLGSILMAYEPIYAIGKSFKDAMKPAEIRETAIFIKKILSDIYGPEEASLVPILYGGSVGSENASDIIKEGGVDGLLVGRESLDIEQFPKLVAEVDNI